MTHGRESAGRRRDHRRDDARDDVARLFDDDRIPLADVLARDVFGVVERRHRDRRPGDEDRFENGIGSVRAGAPDVHRDAQEPGVRLLRRELERRRPARKLGGGPRADRAAGGRPP